MSNSNSNSNTTTSKGTGGVSNLATVSKVFMDYEILGLRRENGSLHLNFFWKDHNATRLQKS